MKLNNIKRIRTEDFPQEDRVLINKLSFALNPFLEQMGTIFNKSIDFDNLNREALTVTIELDAQGIPKTLSQIKTVLKTRIRGFNVIRAENLENDNTYPTSSPFITYTQTGELITIVHVSGIPADKRYRLSLESIG